MLSYDVAYEMIKNEISNLNPSICKIPLLQSIGRVIAEDLIADIDLPPFTNSAMDGYCIKYADSIVSWKLKGEISAGNFTPNEITEIDCVRIMTGAKLPESADTVIPMEDVLINGDMICLNENINLKKGQDVRLAGEDIKKGEIIFIKNHIISSKDINLLASCGFAEIPVLTKVKIGVMTTGDELIDITEIPVDSKIRASNLYSILSQINDIHAEALNLGIVDDNQDRIKIKLEEALNSDIDILITSGGVSVGKYDFIKNILQEMGAELIFWKVNIKPGKPLLFCKYNNGQKTILIFSLPGNPVSAYVNFSIFIKRAFNSIYAGAENMFFIAELKDNLFKQDGKKHFVRAISSFDNEQKKNFVKKTGSQSSGNMSILSQSDCLIIFNEELQELEFGEEVICMRI